MGVCLRRSENPEEQSRFWFWFWWVPSQDQPWRYYKEITPKWEETREAAGRRWTGVLTWYAWVSGRGKSVWGFAWGRRWPEPWLDKIRKKLVELPPPCVALELVCVPAVTQTAVLRSASGQCRSPEWVRRREQSVRTSSNPPGWVVHNLRSVSP